MMFSGLLVMVFAVVPIENRATKKRKNYALAALLLVVLVLVGCGGGGTASDGGGGGATTGGTPAGSYTITVTGKSGSITQSSTLQLTVK